MGNRRSIPLSEVVADSLRQSLKDGVYLCGERLAESVIAREMNVSQNTARDALSVLEKEGWCIKQARRGVTVRSFTIDDALELYTLRAVLERLALGWAMDTMEEAHHMRLANAISEARLQAGMGNRRGLREAIFSFHDALLEAAHKPRTTQILHNLHNQCRLLENLRAEVDPQAAASYADIISEYGDLLTRIRYDERRAAQNTIHDIITEEGRALLPVLDLIL